MTTNTFHISVNTSNISEINSGGEIYELITSNGYTLKNYSRITNILSFTSDDDIKNQVFNKSYVKYKTDEIFFNLNSIVPKFQNKYSYGLDRIGKRTPVLQKKYFGESTGKDVNIFAIDSGVFYNHVSLKEKINLDLAYDAFYQDSDNEFILPYNNISYNDSHGTEIASVILDNDFGTTSNVNYIPVRIFNEIGIASLSDLLDSCNYIIDTHLTINTSTPFGNINYKPSIVHMPFSSKNKVLLLDDVMLGLMDNNIHVITSAGNDNDDCYKYSPQSAGTLRNKVLISGNTYRIDTNIDYSRKPIVVAGLTNPTIDIIQKDKVWIVDDFNGSNWGDIVDIFCPAQDILVGSLSFFGTTWNTSIENYYTYQSGTSFSSAFACGIAAMYLENEKNLTTEQLYNKILRRSTIGSISEGLFNDRENEDNNIFVNPVVVTPNRIGYIWYTPTLINFDAIDTITVDEKTNNNIKITALSTDNFNEKQKNSFFLGTVSSSIPSFSDDNITVTFSDIYEGSNIYGNLNVISDFVTQNEVSNVTITVVDGFADDYRNFQTLTIPINIRNISVMPTWVAPVSSNLGDISQNDVIDITFNCRDLTDGLPIVYTILPSIESLPLGVRVTNLVDGTLKFTGTVGALNKKLRKYEFFIRSTTPVGKFIDKYFFWNTDIINITQTFDTDWLDTLPATVINTNTYYNLGTYPKNRLLGINLLIDNPDNDVLKLRLLKSPDLTTQFGRLPLGLKLNNDAKRIEGIPPSNVVAGTYYFKITVGDGEFSTIGYFSITISNDNVNIVENPSDISWVTPAGLLGEVYETYASHFGVLAKNSVGGKIQYILSSNSNPLPLGLSIDADTGQIVGTTPYVSANSTYTFTVSAYNEFVSVDRTFSFNIISIYDTQNVISIDVLLTGLPLSKRLDLFRLQSTIKKEDIFRETDENFGLKQDLKMYLVAGLNAVTDDVIYKKIQDYHQDLSVKFGNLTYQSVTDTLGNKLYDVLYYEIIDSSSGAAGFNSQNIEVPLPYAQGLIKGQFPYKSAATTTQDYFFSKSLNNFRKDLINIEDRFIRKEPITLAASDNEKQNGIGLSGNEGYPLWMVSKNRNTPEKYISGIVIGHLKYGTAENYIKVAKLNKIDTALSGISLEIDRYLVQRYIISQTSLDDSLIYSYDKTVIVTSYQEVATINDRNNIVLPTYGNVVKVINTNEYYIWNSLSLSQPDGWLDITSFGTFDNDSIGTSLTIITLTTDGNETIFDFDSITNTKVNYDLAILKEKKFLRFSPSDEMR